MPGKSVTEIAAAAPDGDNFFSRGTIVSATTAMTGRRYSWGNCPPQGSFLGANIADSAFLAAFDGHVPESVLRDVRGNVFTESLDWSFDDGFSLTSPVGSFPKRPAVTQYALFDMSGNARE